MVERVLHRPELGWDPVRMTTVIQNVLGSLGQFFFSMKKLGSEVFTAVITIRMVVFWVAAPDYQNTRTYNSEDSDQRKGYWYLRSSYAHETAGIRKSSTNLISRRFHVRDNTLQIWHPIYFHRPSNAKITWAVFRSSLNNSLKYY